MTSGPRGYSLIEVMTAVAVMTIGATGLVLMQGATTRANMLAQETTVAVSIAQTWTERLKRESIGWSSPGNPLTPNLSIAEGEPYLPLATVGDESPVFDHYGFDTLDATRAKYHVRAVNTILHRSGGLADALRVDLIVYWFRALPGSNDPDVANLAPAGYSPFVVIPDALLSSNLTRKLPASVVLQPRAGASL